MKLNQVKSIFENEFDLVGVIKTKDYLQASSSLTDKGHLENYPTMLVLAYSYPKRILHHSDTHLIPSFYTFGQDYHSVMKNKIVSTCQSLPFKYEYGVDNHPLDERLAAKLAGLGFIGKNQLIINKNFGSYIFLGYVLLDAQFDDIAKISIEDSCGDCRKCIDACPTHALSENGYIKERCISEFNQSKKTLSPAEIAANYQLFGCDICQLVCPKNININTKINVEFELSGKERVSIIDLFSDSQKEFNKKYENMAYLWKGKTLLMRNALLLMHNHKNTLYLDLVKSSIDKYQMPWYQETAKYVLDYLIKI